MDEFLDKYVREEKAGNISSPEHYQATAQDTVKKDKWDTILGFIINHPIITIALIVIPISLFIMPLRSAVFGIMGVIFIVLVYINAIILYLVSMMVKTSETPFSKLVLLSIPITLLMQFLTPLGIMIPLGVFTVVTLAIIMYALNFDIGIWKTILLTLGMYVINYMVLVGIVVLLAKATGNA